jgi:16S rRNA (uracil1498-N3)-methyltransferase
MPQNRFFLDAPFSTHANLALDGDELHHLRVMRLAVGETVALVNGKGALAEARLDSLDKKSASLHLLSVEVSSRSPCSIHLGIPLMRPSKLEWLIEKGTELGVDAFFLYRADRSEKEDLSMNQLERLRLLTIAALKQSGRLYLPSMAVMPNLMALSAGSNPTHFFFGDIGTQNRFPEKLSGDTLLVTGPERGFSKEEIALLQSKGTGVKLGTYILRAETAPIAGLAILRWLAF